METFLRPPCVGLRLGSLGVCVAGANSKKSSSNNHIRGGCGQEVVYPSGENHPRTPKPTYGLTFVKNLRVQKASRINSLKMVYEHAKVINSLWWSSTAEIDGHTGYASNPRYPQSFQVVAAMAGPNSRVVEQPEAEWGEEAQQ